VNVLNTEGVCPDRNLLNTDPGRPCWAMHCPRRMAGGSGSMLEADWEALGRCRAVSGAADSVYILNSEGQCVPRQKLAEN
jgi:hypothetical protein